MDKLKDMQLFNSVVDAGSFAKASRAVGLTPAMVGRRIAALEAELGFSLFNRSTRKMQITPGGQSYYDGCKRVLEQVLELEESLTSAHQTNPKGLIRLTAPDGLGSPFLVDAIKSFRLLYPDIRFKVQLSNTPLDLIEQRIDLSFRLAIDLQDSSLVATKVGQSTFGLYGSSEYFEQRGRPTSLDELANHDCMHMGGSRYGDYWRVVVGGKLVSFRQPWVLLCPNTNTLIHAVANGVGIAMLPTLFASTHTESNKLDRLHGVVEFPNLDLYALYPTRQHLPYRVTLFLDFIKAWAGDRLMN